MDFIEYVYRVAYHEAGHVVVGAALGCPVDGVYIEGRPPIANVRSRKSTLALDEARREVAVLMAGYLAERRGVEGDRAEALRGGKDDFARVGWLGCANTYPAPPASAWWPFSRPEQWTALVREQVRMSNRILRNNWEAVAEIAIRLLEEGSLEGRKLKKALKLVESHPLEPSRVIEAMMSAAA